MGLTSRAPALAEQIPLDAIIGSQAHSLIYHAMGYIRDAAQRGEFEVVEDKSGRVHYLAHSPMGVPLELVVKAGHGRWVAQYWLHVGPVSELPGKFETPMYKQLHQVARGVEIALLDGLKRGKQPLQTNGGLG